MGQRQSLFRAVFGLKIACIRGSMLAFFTQNGRKKPAERAQVKAGRGFSDSGFHGQSGATFVSRKANFYPPEPNDDVRLALAGRLVELLPGLPEDKHARLYAFVVQGLGTLALDEILKIRKALASTLRDHAYMPPKMAMDVTRDVEREISEPILRFCVGLSDEDLLEILKSHPSGWAAESAAGRPYIADDEMLMIGEGPGQALSENFLSVIVDNARAYPEWKNPSTLHHPLPVSVLREMDLFIDTAIQDVLMRQKDFDIGLCAEVLRVFRRRMAFVSQHNHSLSSMETRLKTLIQNKRLDEEAVSDALAMLDHDFVYGAIAYLAKTGIVQVKKIFEMRAAKGIVALCWQAGLSMRMAFHLQKDLGRVAPNEIVYPKGGTDYPLTEQALHWQLEFFGLRAA